MTADRSPDRTLLIVATIVYAALSTWLSVASHAFLEADGVTHYLYARFAFDVPAYFVDHLAQGAPVDAAVQAEPLILGGDHRLDQERRDRVEGHGLPAHGLERQPSPEHQG